MIEEESFVRILSKNKIGQVSKILKNKIYVEYPAEEYEYIEEVFSPEQLEYIPPFSLNAKNLRQLIRKEISIHELSDQIMEGNVILDEEYEITLEDIECALRKFDEATQTWDVFVENWLLYFYYHPELSVAFCLEDYFYNEIKSGKDFLPLSETNIVREIIVNILAEKVKNPCPSFIKDILSFKTEQNVPFHQRHYSDIVLHDYMCFYEKKSNLKKASQEEVALFVKCVDHFVEQKDSIALRIKGYGCYGGNRAFPCDWYTSRDCLLQLYETEPDCQLANTLGYIYFYGRCNEGIPEYELAFKYFSIGAAGGLYESTYKLADMYAHGYAVPKMEQVAYQLYERVYQDNLIRFQKGEMDCNMADAALRMGNAYRDNFVSGPIESAYRYYLEADYAIRKRVQIENRYGDTHVYSGIQKALKECSEEYHKEEPVQEYANFDVSVISKILSNYGSRRVHVMVEPNENMTGKIIMKPILRKTEKSYQILWTVPEVDYCSLVDCLEFISTEKVEKCSFTFDDVYCDYSKNLCSFYLGQDKVASLKIQLIRWTPPKKAEKKENKIRFASICFPNSNRAYDYLCDNEAIQIGDKVVVSSYRGEVVVEVQNIHYEYEEDIAIPLERFKKILKKL